MRTIPARIQGTPDSDNAVAKAPVALAMGFRPFFLSAGLFAVAASLGWVWALFTGASPSHIPPVVWHGHEMVFGFTMAVVAGFLLTAARNWTGLDTAHGFPLLALVALWGAGRIAMIGDWLPAEMTAVIVVSFPLCLAAVVGRVIFKARRVRNYGIVGVLGALALASGVVHLDALGFWPGSAQAALYGGVHLMVLLTVVIGGRIIPLFTRNKTGDDAIRSVPAVDYAAVVLAMLVGALAVAFVAGAVPGVSFGVAAAVSGLTQLYRMRTWGTGGALRIPMLAVLHAGYAWIGIGHLLLAAGVAGSLPVSVALHALTIGAIGTLTLGMMARVTLGHTGRDIVAPRLIAAAFAAVSLATVARILGAFVPEELLRWTWFGAGMLFALGFFVYAAWGWRILTGPRPDGRPG